MLSKWPWESRWRANTTLTLTCWNHYKMHKIQNTSKGYTFMTDNNTRVYIWRYVWSLKSYWLWPFSLQAWALSIRCFKLKMAWIVTGLFQCMPRIRRSQIWRWKLQWPLFKIPEEILSKRRLHRGPFLIFSLIKPKNLHNTLRIFYEQQVTRFIISRGRSCLRWI